MRTLLAVSVCAGLLAAGCSAPPVDWKARVGRYSYDDAVREMGVPDRETHLSDGSTASEWLKARGMSEGTMVMPRGAAIQDFQTYNDPNTYLDLIFDKAGRLASWKLIYR
jgi:hypothetical protein